MLNAVMVDLETMGNGNNAAIVQIGAFKFDLNNPQRPEEIEDGQKFFVGVDLASCMRLGLKADASTIMWWLKQSDAARSGISAGLPLPQALGMFSEFMRGTKFQLWGNGATFDNVILRSAYDAAGIEAPWHYTMDCCYRTYKNLHGKAVPFVRQGTHHNALDDAITQGLHLQKIMAQMKATGDPQTTLKV